MFKESQKNHIPVLCKTVLEVLRFQSGDVVVDANVGLGGHAEKILEIIGEKGFLIAFDLDRENLEAAKVRLQHFQDRVRFFQENFEHLESCVKEAGFDSVDKIFFDLGLSSPQLEDQEKGFSFLREGPLDMRFDHRQQLTAAQVLNFYREDVLIRIFRDYGEIRHARKLARAIVNRRRQEEFRTTLEFTHFIENLRIGDRRKKIHPATQAFQALRIEVNREFEALETALRSSIYLLKPGGRIGVISYHSLEDRVVKNVFRNESRDCLCPPEILLCQCSHKANLKILSKKPLQPSPMEIYDNPRARSAKFRAAEKIVSLPSKFQHGSSPYYQ